MEYKVTDDIAFENARIIYRNFSGREQQFNRAGCRNFCVEIDDAAFAQKLADNGWNVKTRQPRDGDDEAKHYIQVTVSFEYKTPKVYLIAGRSKQLMDEDDIGELDYADIKNVDLTINPYNWAASGKTGVKAYLKSMYVTIEEDVFADKYSDI